MINPIHNHPNYEASIQALEKAGYHFPAPSEIPKELEGILMAETLMFRNGYIVSVHHATGKITAIQKAPEKVEEKKDLLHKWETVFRPSIDDPLTQRMEVPGGWIYLVRPFGLPQTLTFVPFPKEVEK